MAGNGSAMVFNNALGGALSKKNGSRGGSRGGKSMQRTAGTAIPYHHAHKQFFKVVQKQNGSNNFKASLIRQELNALKKEWNDYKVIRETGFWDSVPTNTNPLGMGKPGDVYTSKTVPSMNGGARATMQFDRRTTDRYSPMVKSLSRMRGGTDMDPAIRFQDMDMKQAGVNPDGLSNDQSAQLRADALRRGSERVMREVPEMYVRQLEDLMQEDELRDELDEGEDGYMGGPSGGSLASGRPPPSSTSGGRRGGGRGGGRRGGRNKEVLKGRVKPRDDYHGYYDGTYDEDESANYSTKRLNNAYQLYY